jgi:hypothetical protein
MESTGTFDTSTRPVIERLPGEGRLNHKGAFPSCTFVTSVFKVLGISAPH